MNSDLFVPIKFNTKVQLKSNEIGKNIDDILLSKLKNTLENTCSKHGYIKQNSISILKRTMGKLVVSHFNGNIEYEVQCVAEICNPAQGCIIKCRVKAKNSLGLLAEGFYNNIPILHIIVPKISAGIQSEINIETINIGDEVKIEVCGKKFLLYDKHISIIGKVIKDREENIENIVEENVDEDDEKNTEDQFNIGFDIDDIKSIRSNDIDDEDEDIDDELIDNDEIGNKKNKDDNDVDELDDEEDNDIEDENDLDFIEDEDDLFNDDDISNALNDDDKD